MPQIPQYYKQQRLTATAGNTPLSGQDIYQMSADNREIENAGHAMTEFGMRYLEKAHRAQIIDQVNTFQAETSDEVNKYFQTLTPNTDPEKFREGLNNLLSQRRSVNLGKLSNNEAKDRANQWLTEYEVSAKNEAFWKSQTVWTQQATSRVNYNLELKGNEAINAENDKKFNLAMTDAKKLLMEAGGEGEEDGFSLLNKDEANIKWLQFEQEVKEKRQKVTLETAKNNIEQRTVDIAAAETQKAIAEGKSESEARKAGYAAAFDWLDDPKTAKEYIDLVPLKDQQEVWKDVNGRVSYRKAQEEETYKKTVNDTGQEIIKQMNANDSNVLSFVDNSDLNADDKISWRDRVIADASRKAKGEDIVTNPITYSDLKTKALSIWQGKNTKEDFDKELNDAKYGTIINGKLIYAMGNIKSDKPLIDNTAYQSLSDTAITELKRSQVDALAVSDELAGKALVDYKSEPEWLAAFSSATGEEKKTLSDKRKLQYEILNQYNNEIKNWLVENPKASGKEFEQFRDKKRYEYINHRAELEKKVKTRIESFENPESTKPMRKQGETIAEYLKRTGQE